MTAPGHGGGVTGGPTDEALLAGYVADALARIERGDAVDATALCAEHPHLATELEDALRLVDAVPTLHRQARDDDSWLGRRLGGRYEILTCVGAGAMGAVYRARDLELERDVAVKVLHREIGAGTRAAERFARESRALAALEHHNVLTVFDRGVNEGRTPFLVTELLEGVSLKDVLEWSIEAMPDGPSAATFARTDWLAERLGGVRPGDALRGERSYLRAVLSWCADVANGLDAAHRAGVLHRDVKPSNVFIAADGRVVLLDFGIAYRVGDPSVTDAGSAIGTPYYMAPEQVRGGDEVDARVDVYGLAASLYHLLALRPPFEGDSPRVLLRLMTEDPPPAHRLHKGLPRDVRAIVERGLDRDPRRRYADARALESDLRAFLAHRPVRARPIGPVGRLYRTVRRKPTGTAAIATAASSVALLVLSAWLWSAWSEVRAHEEYAQRSRRLASDLAIEGWPDQRILPAVAQENRDAVALLDDLLELRPDQHGTRLVRAALHLDLGDHAAAHADLELIAARAASRYLRAVAARYAAADDSLRGIEAVNLGDLPEPVTAIDCFVAGFHALRARDHQRSADLLGRCPEDDLAARDLRLLALLGIETRASVRQAYEAALHLEGVYGHDTARTQHVIGVGHLIEQRWEKAIAPFERSLELRPDRHGPLQNLGLAHLRLRHFVLAKDYYERAHALRPWMDNTKSGLAQVCAELRDYDAAWRHASDIEPPGWRSYEQAAIRVTEALHCFVDGDVERMQESAAEAVDLFDESLRHEKHQKVAAVPGSIEVAKAIATNRIAATIAPLLLRLFQDPRNPNQLLNLSGLLRGESLSEQQVLYLRLFLTKLAVDLAPDDPIARERLDAVVSEINARIRQRQQEPGQNAGATNDK